MRISPTALALTLLTGVVASACSNGSAPDSPITRVPAQLNVVVLPAGHLPLVADSVAFWAKKGTNREVSIFFQDNQGAQGQEFLRFKVEADALMLRPDGTSFQTGDSVLISIKASPDSVLFDFQPKGLQFNPARPAELDIMYQEAGDDFDHDGIVTAQDSLIKSQLAIWRQELLSDPFIKLQSLNFEDMEEIEAEVLGFTRFAIAY